MATEVPCSPLWMGAVNGGGQNASAGSESEEVPVTEESSEDCEATSDQTEAEEDEAEEAIEELYGPLG